VTEGELLQKLDDLNEDHSVHGVLLQMPLDSENTIDSHLATNRILSSKDVDGLTTINQGKVATGDLGTGFIPCTPAGCMDLIKKSGVKIQGAKAVVVGESIPAKIFASYSSKMICFLFRRVGRSKIVGTPVAELLKWHHATVTVCHSKSILEDSVKEADILVVAIGSPLFVKGSWVKPGAVVIDCGINSVDDSSKKAGYRLVGDVDFEEASKVTLIVERKF
jgi:methylenetetrahydrofolate dehydrogenase (NADP+)/methenyltetrahydrofolate cyclohydrolase/formyltetrahydrofolate synthetase